jgi:hypothetical protein
MGKPCKIQVFDYYRPRGDRDDPWRFGDRCHPEPGEYALLCDSEEHADNLLSTLRELDARNAAKVKP